MSNRGHEPLAKDTEFASVTTPARGVTLTESRSQCAFEWNEDTTGRCPPRPRVAEKCLTPRKPLLYALSILQNP